MEIAPSTIESDRFGVHFARLTLAENSIVGLAAKLADADADGVDVISVRVDILALPAIRGLQDAGFRLMDTLVYHRLATSLVATEDRYVIAALSHEVAPAAAAVARRAFAGYLGHYHADPRLADDAATEAYADWIHRALQAPAVNQIALGCTVDGRLKGFVLGLRRANGASEITLNAVDPAAQGSGVYRAMLREYLAQAYSRGDREVIISTQLQNYGVQRVWSREGFLLSHAQHTFHRWTSAQR